jgi:hypothetical protein
VIPVPLGTEVLSPGSIAWLSRGLTALIGLFVAVLAYRGFKRNDAPKMRLLALGIGLLTTGVFLAVTVANVAGADTGGILIARGLVTVTGLCAVLLALLYQ